MEEQQQERRPIYQAQLRGRSGRSFSALRENQREVQQQRRGQHQRRDLRPIDFVVEGVQFAAVVERIEDERHKAEDEEMHGARSVPSFNENEQTDEEVEQSYNTLVVLDRGRFFGRSGN